VKLDLFRPARSRVFARTVAGIAVVAARQWEAAEEHFQIALQQAEVLPNVLEQKEIRRFHAMMLIDRAAQVIAKRRKRCSEKRRRATRRSECPATSR
jgi:hypothetical protein